MSCSKFSKTYMKSPKFGCDPDTKCSFRRPISYHRKCFSQFDACGGNPSVTGGDVIIYVDARYGNDANTGDSPSTALKTLDGAIARLGTRSGTVGIIQLIGNADFVLPEDYVFDARDLELKYSRIVIRGTRSNVVNGTINTITVDHGPNTPTITGNPPVETGNVFRWQTIDATGLTSGLYDRAYLENFTNGHTYTIKENTANSISVIVGESDVGFALEQGEKYQIYTISNLVVFSGNLYVYTNIDGFVEFNGVRISPLDANSKITTNLFSPYLKFVGSEIYFPDTTFGPKVFEGSYTFEGCVINSDATTPIGSEVVSFSNKTTGLFNTSIIDRSVIQFSTIEISSCWLIDSMVDMQGEGICNVSYALVENAIEPSTSNLFNLRGISSVLRRSSIIDTRPTSGREIFAVSTQLMKVNASRISTASDVFSLARVSHLFSSTSSWEITGGGRFLYCDERCENVFSSTIIISRDVTTTTNLFEIRNSGLSLNTVSLTRSSPGQTIVAGTKLSNIRMERVDVDDVILPTAPAIQINYGSHGYGDTISGITSNQLKVGANVVGILQTQLDDTENCTWTQV